MAFNVNGNVLISDQFNNRVFEATPRGEIVWSYGLGPATFVLAPQLVLGPQDAQRVGDKTLIAAAGIPADTVPAVPLGVVDNRVILVDRFKNIIWQYGQFGLSGSGPNLLNVPVQATFVPHRPACQPICQPVCQPVCQPLCQPVCQPVCQPLSCPKQYGCPPRDECCPEKFDCYLNRYECGPKKPNCCPEKYECCPKKNNCCPKKYDCPIELPCFTNGYRFWEPKARYEESVYPYTDPYVAADPYVNPNPYVDPYPNPYLNSYAYPNQYAYPYDRCHRILNGTVLITDQGNNRIIQVDEQKTIVWQYPGTNTNPTDQLNGPSSAEKLENGNVLIADTKNNRALEVGLNDVVLKVFTASGTLGACAFASRLPNGNTLLTDATNNRIVEVDRNDHIVWQYVTNTDYRSIAAPKPSRGLRLKNGDTLISDQYNNRVIKINQTTRIDDYYGLPLNSGTNIGYNLLTTQLGLYAPHDAKIIGDYTGITRP